MIASLRSSSRRHRPFFAFFSLLFSALTLREFSSVTVLVCFACLVFSFSISIEVVAKHRSCCLFPNFYFPSPIPALFLNPSLACPVLFLSLSPALIFLYTDYLVH
mmetsp:Transcript_34756/g.90149  ORF Transcript_34756/g.90149 Transcript_34756/m.90149 type:complete len:105 (+) Transcript_34756:4191-4505(+)